ncbi:SIR2 family protein [Methylobacterium sp.]|uniref:SIR2 family protein n=1 Tax=Methylobacterium sp. TaxID=409 RepID=UPI00259006C8|nr:SIR2 family protein [Methylobacterium sp.]
MADVIAPRIDRSARDVAEKILFAREDDRELGKVIFLIGAGCSISAGVPGAVEIGRRMTREVARRLGRGSPGDDAETAYRALVRDEFLSPAEGPAGGIDWYRVYDEMFRRHYAAPDDSRALFGAVVEEAKGAINWAHLCLGELVARRLVSTVLTTNFDQLVLSGMVRAGILPVICDGVESLNRIAGAPRHPQLVELHGSRHTYLLRNRPEDVRDVWHNPQASAAVQKLLQHATTFVVVGYGGREDGVMDLLVQAAAVYRDKNLFWVQHSPDPRTLSPKAQAFLATSRNGGLLVGQDADGFFLDLCRALGVGVPSALSDPLKAVGRLIADLDAYRSPNADIRAEIDRARARHAFLHERLEDAAADTTEVEQIRELRLAGHDAEAYARAERALATVGDLTEAPIELLKEAAGAALAFGRSSPDAAPLRQAVAYLRQLARRGGSSGTDERPPVAIPLAEAPHQAAAAAIEADAAPERAALQRQLGLALTSLGERESKTARLEEAVAIFRTTLTERMRGQAPLDWASNQNSLGIALARLGERESGTARLEEAVAAYRAALEERTRERAPLDWAETQNNLGNALKSLSERESGTVRLEEAVAAFRAAQEELTADRAPAYAEMVRRNSDHASRLIQARTDPAAGEGEP